MENKTEEIKVNIEVVEYDPSKVTEETMALANNGEYAKEDGRGD